MYLHPSIAECADCVHEAHQNDDRARGGDYFEVMSGHVHVHDILTHRVRQAFQEPLRFDRTDVHALSRVLPANSVVIVRISTRSMWVC